MYNGVMIEEALLKNMNWSPGMKDQKITEFVKELRVMLKQ